MLRTQSGSLIKNHGDGLISYFTETAILWLAGTVMGEIGPVTFNGDSNAVIGEHGYGRGRARNI